MVKHGKKYSAATKQIEQGTTFSLKQALELVKKLAFAKFDESIDIAVNVSIDPSKGEQSVRSSVLMPHGTGKPARVIAFAGGKYADEATAAGADLVGSEDLIEKISGGWLEFDYAVSTPDLMGKVGKLAKLLGPRGLLPNKKVGTVTFDVGGIIQDLKKGRIFFKNDKNAIVHASVGKVSFSPDGLYENIRAFFKALVAAKPPSSKGKFLKSITLTSTMGVGIPVSPDDVASL